MARCLNFDRTWDEIGNIETASGQVMDAFSDGVADKVLLEAGTKLYKFNSNPTLFNSHAPSDASAFDRELLEEGHVLSPWWSPYDDYIHV